MTTVVIPALNEARNIEFVIELAKRSPAVGEIIVVDDGSIDDTRDCALRSGARVVTSSLLGKGASMEDGFLESNGDIVVYLDGDLRGLASDLIERLVEPIQDGSADFVKARFSRSAGRVTTLTAKPLMETFFPELAYFAQPLGGIIAVRRSALEQLTFEADYGVDLALLIDARFLGLRLAEVDIGHLEHDSQTLEALGKMAKQVARALLHRAEKHGRLHIRQVREVEEIERQTNAEFAVVLNRMEGGGRLALIDMDGTLLRDRSIIALGKKTGRLEQILPYLDNPALSPQVRAKKIAGCLKGIPKSTFVELARSLPLSDGAAETVVALRKQGFRVGIVSDSFCIFTEIIRRRVFADFSVANLLRFEDGFASGQLSIAPIFQHPAGCGEHEFCKRNVLLHLEEKLAICSSRVLAIGDSANDVCLLRHAGFGVAFEPKSEEVELAANVVIRGDLRQALDYTAELTQAVSV